MPAVNALRAPSVPDGRSSAEARRLVVAWQHPGTRSIEPVGLLTYDTDGYRFTYIKNALSVEGFRPLMGFDDLRREYRSAELFPLFAQRAMDARRPDFRRYVTSLGLTGEPEPWEQIERSQGMRRGDTLQLLPEPTVVGDKLSCMFLVNGVRHVHEETLYPHGREVRVTSDEVEAALASLKPGDPLGLAPEPKNPKNPLAVIVLGPSSVPVGWVPNLLVEDLQRLMAIAHVTVTAEHINPPGTPPHMRLLARLTAAPARHFRFFTGPKWEPLT